MAHEAWLWHHVDSLRATLARLARAPLAALFNIGVIGIALALPAGLYVALDNLQASARALASDPQLSLFLALDAGRADVAQIEARLKQHPGRAQLPLRAARPGARGTEGAARAWPTSSTAWRRIRCRTRSSSKRRTPRRRRSKRCARSSAQWPKVAHVQLDAAWARRLEAGLKLGRLAVSHTGGAVRVRPRRRHLQHHPPADTDAARGNRGRAADRRDRRLHPPAVPLLRRAAGTAPAGSRRGRSSGCAIQLLNGGLAELSQLYAARIELRHLDARGQRRPARFFRPCLGWLGSWLSVSRHLGQIELQ